MSEPYLRPAVESDRPQICRFLRENMSDKFSLAEWDRLFTYDWLEDKPDLGRILEKRGDIIGFIGNIYSIREIRGRSEWIVSLTAWYLHKAFRKQGLGRKLMLSATDDPNMTYTLLNSSAKTLHLLPDLGFRIMDDTRFYWQATGGPASHIRTVGAPDIARTLAGDKQKLLADHLGLPVKSFAIQANDRQCLIMFSVVTKRDGRLYYDALHIGDPALFATHAQEIANALLPGSDAVLAVDSRFLHKQKVEAETVKLSVPLSFKTTRLHPWDIDNLYTEIQLMDLKLR